MARGFFLCVDILGFSELVHHDENQRESKKDEVEGKINTWISITETLTEKYSLSSYQLISDTLFVGVNDKPDDFYKLISFLSEFL